MQAANIVGATAAVTGAIQLAAARRGVDFGYLYAQARLESRFDPAAAARGSSARGLFQFTAGTWLDMVRRHGAEVGLGGAAAALAAGADPATRAAILDLRRDPALSADLAAAFAADNCSRLETALGRPASATDLYCAHFMGAAGAIKFLRAKDADPAAAAAALMPAAAHANRAVFFAADGSARGLGEVYDRFAAKLAGNAVPAGGNLLPVQPPARFAARVEPAVAPAAAARLAYLSLAVLGG